MYKPSFNEFKELSKRGNLIPVYREILADEETPVTALLKIRKRPYAFLLESVEGGEKWGRYTFLGADPLAVVRVKSEAVEVRSNGNLMQTAPRGRSPGGPEGAARPIPACHRGRASALQRRGRGLLLL